MSVRAKFKVNEIRRHQYGTDEMQTIAMTPVYCDKEGSENHEFWNATPQGKVELGVINLKAANFFELGKEYYLDFTPANK